jgi:hypothetical protein
MTMNMIRSLEMLMLFFLVSIAGKAQIETKFISGQKPEYIINDQFTIQFKLTVDPKSCRDGMEKTAIFPSGIKIEDKSEWTELQKGVWQITLKCVITGNKKGIGQLTVVRRNDKQDLFEQVKFKIIKNVDI